MPKVLRPHPESRRIAVDVGAFTKLCRSCNRVLHSGQFRTLPGHKKAKICKTCEEAKK